MIIKFSVKNFRSIKNKITLSFEATKSNDLEKYYIIEPKKGLRILKVGLIYGANASGKTTILEALDFLRSIVVNPFEDKKKVFEFKPFLFDKTSPKQNTFFSLEFIQNNIKYLYEVELNQKAIVNEALFFYNPNKALVYKRKTDLKKQLSDIYFGTKIKIKKDSKISLIGNTLWNNTVLGGYMKTNFESNELQNVVEWFNNKFKPIVKPGTMLIPFISDKIIKKKINKNNVIKILKKADLGISDILIKNEEIEIDEDIIDLLKKRSLVPDKEIEKIIEKGKIETMEIFLMHFVNNDEYSLPLEEESAGTKRYFEFSGILSMIFKEKNILLIDELESSLHPDLIKHFLLTFLVNSTESQIIATTHHRELLMEKDILRNDVIWFTEKQKDFSTDLFSLADFNTSIIRNTSSIYNAYKIGKLGAVPNLEDYYLSLD